MANYFQFTHYKRTFFDHVAATKIKELGQLEEQCDFQFIATNKYYIEEEFLQLFTYLKQEDFLRGKDENFERFLFFCYYCCWLLQDYYTAYGQKAKAKEYGEYLLQIKERSESLPRAWKTKDNCNFRILGKKIARSLSHLASNPFPLSKVRTAIEIFSLWRTYWYFCRTMVKSFFGVAEIIFNKSITDQKIFELCEMPNGVLQALGVGCSIVRFMINAGMLLKHTFLPSDKEKMLSLGQRFKNEIYKRHADLLSDFVWGTISTLTGYNEVFAISTSLAGSLAAGFITFDIALLLWQRYLAERKYLAKKNQYLCELMSCSTSSEAFAKRQILKQQLQLLEISWKSKNETYLFNIVAAILLMTGFSASMLITTPLILSLGCYVVCTFACSMYLSSDAYQSYREKMLLWQKATKDNFNSARASKEYSIERRSFINTLLKNAVVPIIMIGLLAVCWQAALVVTALYLGYLSYQTYAKHARAEAVTRDNETTISRAYQSPGISAA